MLRLIHGYVGGAQECMAVVAVRRVSGNTDACANMQFDSLDDEWFT